MNGTLRLRRRVASELALGSIAVFIGLMIIAGGVVLPGGFGSGGVFGNMMAFGIGGGLALFGLSLVRSFALARRAQRAMHY